MRLASGRCLHARAQALMAGADEAGRGPLVGSVVAAAVILPDGFACDFLTDSKKMTAKRREAAFEVICKGAVAWAIAEASAAEIDQLNILWASMLAMKRAIESLPVAPQSVQVDGNRCPAVSYPCTAVVRGDQSVLAISAASVLAKVWRDRQMQALDAQYPRYGFAKHNGYPTAEHLAAIARYGVIEAHRRSFGPVRRALEVS